MSSRGFSVLCLAAVFAVGGCRQPDGPLPIPDGDVPNRIEDIGRDIENIASGNSGAVRELADDLRVFIGDKTAAVPASDELSRRAAAALTGTKLSDDRTVKISRHLWTSVAARELSEKQRETLQSDLHSALLEAGVDEPRAASVAAQAGEVQNQVTDRRRRWYELQ